MKFRFHRGSLAESMATVVDVPDRAALEKLVRESLPEPFADGMISVSPYGFDARIGWDSHIVEVEGFGPVGFTDGPALS